MVGTLNPQITTVEVGIKSLREVTIYPLSMADQKKIVKLCSKEISEADIKMAKMTDVAAVEFIVNLITNNLQKILKFVLADSDSITEEELTNVQLADIAETIYEANFAYALGKFKTLIQKMKPVVPSPVIQKLKLKKETLIKPSQSSLKKPVTN